MSSVTRLFLGYKNRLWNIWIEGGLLNVTRLSYVNIVYSVGLGPAGKRQTFFLMIDTRYYA